jgi:hypothetical protein
MVRVCTINISYPRSHGTLAVAESIKSFLTIVVPLVAAAAVGYYLYTIASSQPTTAQSTDAQSDKSMVRIDECFVIQIIR